MKKLLLTLILTGMSASAAVGVKDIVGKYSVGACTFSVEPKRVYIQESKFIGAQGLLMRMYDQDASQLEFLLGEGLRGAPGSTNPAATQSWKATASFDGITSVEVLKLLSQGVNQTTTKSFKFVRNILVYSEVTVGSNGRVISEDKCELYKAN